MFYVIKAGAVQEIKMEVVFHFLGLGSITSAPSILIGVTTL